MRVRTLVISLLGCSLFMLAPESRAAAPARTSQLPRAANGTIPLPTDLSIAKSSDGTVNAGDPIDYVVTVNNLGPDFASNVTITDVAPAGTVFSADDQTSGPAFTCMVSSGTITCSIPSFASGAAATFHFAFVVPANAAVGSTVTNTATVSDTSGDPNMMNNSATDVATVTASADLSVTKTGPPTVSPGNNITYTINVTNNGPSDAQVATLTDVLPAGTTFVMRSQTAGPAFTCTDPPAGSGGSVSCSIATLAAGASSTFSLTLHVPSSQTGFLANTATVSSMTPDPNMGNDSATQNAEFSPSADVAVVKTGPSTAGPGSDVTYSITVSNNGPSDEPTLTLTDDVPTGTTFVSEMQTSGPPFSCMDPVVGMMGTVSCSGPVAVGAVATFTVVVHVDPAAGVGSSFTNSAVLSPGAPDPDMSNNNSSVTTTVGQPDLAIFKNGPASVTAGQMVVYTITVNNGGGAPATGVTVDDPTPAGLTFVSNSGACITAFPCSLGTLNPGSPATITSTYTAMPAFSGTVTNTATVSSTPADSDTTNNSASAMTVVAGAADLSLTKTGPPVVTAGQNIVYTIVVTNSGPSPATGVSVADPTPAGVTFVSNSGACVTTFPCDLGTLNSGQSATITSTFSTLAAFNGLVTNSATASSATGDAVPGNNTGVALTLVGGSADLSVTKSGPASVTAGQNIVYTIVVTNAGPSPATAVSLNDIAPGLTFVSNSGGCTTVFPCSLGTLSVGQVVTITSTFSTSPTFSGSVMNSATAFSIGTTDPNPINNTGSTTTTVGAGGADVAITKTTPSSSAPFNANVTYNIAVTNNGPAAASGVTVTDVLPAGFTFVSATPSQGSCAGTATVVCSLGALANGANATIALVATAPATAGMSSNTATVATTSVDSNAANNSATATVSVGATIPTLSSLSLALLAMALALLAWSAMRR